MTEQELVGQYRQRVVVNDLAAQYLDEMGALARLAGDAAELGRLRDMAQDCRSRADYYRAWCRRYEAPAR